MSDWLEIRNHMLWQREQQITSRLDEVEGLLKENTDAIVGLSGPLKQLISNAGKPTHAIGVWKQTLSHADEILQLGYTKRHEMDTGGSE